MAACTDPLRSIGPLGGRTATMSNSFRQFHHWLGRCNAEVARPRSPHIIPVNEAIPNLSWRNDRGFPHFRTKGRMTPNDGCGSFRGGNSVDDSKISSAARSRQPPASGCRASIPIATRTGARFPTASAGCRCRRRCREDGLPSSRLEGPVGDRPWRAAAQARRSHRARMPNDWPNSRSATTASCIAEMSMQTAYMAQWFHYYGGLADKIEGAVLPTDKPDTFNYTRYEPLGVVAAIVPWNSPLLLLTWKLAPALAAGNTVVIKPSEFTSALDARVHEADRGGGLSARRRQRRHRVRRGRRRAAGRASARGEGRVHRIATPTGQRIYEAAARGLKHVTMELGGKSPNIVFDDAELDNAVKGVISGIFAATGQTCIAGSRLLVQREHSRPVPREARGAWRRRRRWATR